MPIKIEGLKLYTVQDLSKILDVTPVTLRKYIRTGRIKAQKVGRRYMVTQESLKEFLNGTYKRKKVEILGSTDGTPNQRFTLMNTPIIEGSLILQVDEGDGWKIWKEVEDFSESTKNDKHYVINRSTGEINFGDGIHGMKLPEGNKNVIAKYRYGEG